LASLGSLEQPMIEILTDTSRSINLAFHLVNAFFILEALPGSIFFFFEPFFLPPFFLAGQTFSTSSIKITDG